MQSISRRLLAVPALAFAAACASEPDTAMSPELQKDLQLATSTSLELATARHAAVVSALESATPGRAATGDRVAQAAPRRQSPPAAAPVPRRQASLRTPAPAPAAVEAEPDYVEPASPFEDEVVVEAAGDTEALPAGGPVVTTDGVGTGRPRDPGGWGGDVGTAGPGVVIRGGGVGDDDHCRIHRRPGRGPVYGGYPPVVYGPVYGGGTRGGSYPTTGTGRARAGGTAAPRPRDPAPSTARPAPASTGGRARARGG